MVCPTVPELYLIESVFDPDVVDSHGIGLVGLGFLYEGHADIKPDERGLASARVSDYCYF